MSLHDKSWIVVLLFAVVITLLVSDSDLVVDVNPPLPNDMVGLAVHPLSSSFSTANSGFSLSGNNVYVRDTVVYRTGWYSINGTAWKSFNLTGTSYNGNVNWLRGFATRTLSNFGAGEHYVIVYSCNFVNGWDCHDNKWQLIVINNSIPAASSGEIRYLVQDGVALSDIVISPDAPNSVKLAANYLQYYIDDMTGVNLSISNVPSTDYEFHVYVGRSTYTDTLGINASGCENGGFKMISGDDYLVLLGQDDVAVVPGFNGVPGPRNETAWDQLVNSKWGENYRWSNDFIKFYGNGCYYEQNVWDADKKGSLNAVYEFLYGQGIRWYHPGWYEYPDIGTVIPEKQDISFEDVNKLVNPDFAMRSLMLYGKALGNLGYYHYADRADEEAKWRYNISISRLGTLSDNKSFRSYRGSVDQIERIVVHPM